MKAMKYLYLVLQSFLFFFFTACSTVEISTNIDRTVDLGDYTTFNFSKEMDHLNLSTTNQRKLKEAITAELKSNNYVLSPNSVLFINAFIKGTKTGIPSNYGWASPPVYVDLNRFPDGTLFIDLIDIQDKRLIWEAIVQGLINPKTESFNKNIYKVMDRTFSKFPE